LVDFFFERKMAHLPVVEDAVGILAKKKEFVEIWMELLKKLPANEQQMLFLIHGKQPVNGRSSRGSQ
jgi:hypothetical protein